MSTRADKVRQVQDLRRSSAASPPRNKKVYTRTTKHRARRDLDRT